jgi:hypothetical protein
LIQQFKLTLYRKIMHKLYLKLYLRTAIRAKKKITRAIGNRLSKRPAIDKVHEELISLDSQSII